MDAIPSFTVSLLDLHPPFGPLTARFLPTFCAKLRCRSALPVPFGGPLVAPEGEGFPLLGAPLRCRFATFCPLLCRLGALRSPGLMFRFLLLRTLVRGFAGGGRRANTRDEMEVLAASNLFTGGASTIQDCGLGAVIVVAAESDFPPVGRGGVSGGMKTGSAGPAPTPTSAAS
jgi:hypothetical protein